MLDIVEVAMDDNVLLRVLEKKIYDRFSLTYLRIPFKDPNEADWASFINSLILPALDWTLKEDSYQENDSKNHFYNGFSLLY